MEWFNAWGLGFMAVIMVPNVVFMLKCPEGFQNAWQNKTIETLEQIGRFGCFGLMIFDIPGTCFGVPGAAACTLYRAAGTVLVLCYCVVWAACFRKNSLFRALALSVLPSVLFLFSGLIRRSVLLTIAALLFAPCHILLSYKNAAAQRGKEKGEMPDADTFH